MLSRNSRNANYGNYLSCDSDDANLIRLAADLISAGWPSALNIRAFLIERNQSRSAKGMAYHATSLGLCLRVDVKMGVRRCAAHSDSGTGDNVSD